MPITLRPRVLQAVYDPPSAASGGCRLSEMLGWNNVDTLVQSFVDDLRKASFGIVNYQVVSRIDLDTFPKKVDGYRYTFDSYLSAWRAGTGFHQPDWADYWAILQEINALESIEGGLVDEIWLFAFPYAGFYESRMVGPDAFWCNAPPIKPDRGLSRRFVMMGFNFERGLGEMLESFAHRAESIMSRVYRNQRGRHNLWERFTRYDMAYPGMAEVGTVHYAPNSRRDYDWGNPQDVSSCCDAWYDFPVLDADPRMVNCSEWGNGDMRSHHLWWFEHFPHIDGSTEGISNNWWRYVCDPNRVV